MAKGKFFEKCQQAWNSPNGRIQLPWLAIRVNSDKLVCFWRSACKNDMLKSFTFRTASNRMTAYCWLDTKQGLIDAREEE